MTLTTSGNKRGCPSLKVLEVEFSESRKEEKAVRRPAKELIVVLTIRKNPEEIDLT